MYIITASCVPMSTQASLFPPSTMLQGLGGSLLDVSDVLSRKRVIGLYFSAHWCGPCRSFTPQLVRCYEQLKLRDPDDFEVVFVSSDRTQDGFNKYFDSMPWYALPFKERSCAFDLSDKFRISSIPALVFVNADGVVGSVNGRDLIIREPEGFPWGLTIARAIITKKVDVTPSNVSDARSMLSYEDLPEV